MEGLVKTSDTLFTDDTVVIHVSGDADTAGRILKVNQSLSKVFGYTKTEVTGHFNNILMPSIYGKRHRELMEKFFQTGHKPAYNKEVDVYGLHRNGFCFHLRVLVKQLPCLEEGIVYVGMLRQIHSDLDFILTDMKGVIDSFSSGVTTMLNLPVALFKESDINIQILAPELINAFSPDKKRNIIEKYKEIGGQKLTFFVPKDFAVNVQLEAKKNSREIGKNQQVKISPVNKKGKVAIFRELNKDLNKHNGIAKMPLTPQQLIQSSEYKESETKQCIKCEINDLSYGDEHKDIEPLKLRIFKLSGIKTKGAGSSISVSSEAEEFYRLCSVARSNASLHSPEAVKRENFQNIENIKEIDKNLINLMGSNGQINKIKEEEKEVKLETKTTEKLPGNVITTESRVETQEVKFNIVRKPNPESKQDQQKSLDLKYISTDKVVGKSTGEDLTLPMPQDLKKKESHKFILPLLEAEEQLDSPLTPKMDLGYIKGPNKSCTGSNAAEMNSVAPNEILIVEDESNNSTIKDLKKKYGSEKQIGIDLSNSEKANKVEFEAPTGNRDKKSFNIRGGGSLGERNYNGLDFPGPDDNADQFGEKAKMERTVPNSKVQMLGQATERNQPHENMSLGKIILRHSLTNIGDKEKLQQKSNLEVRGLIEHSMNEKHNSSSLTREIHSKASNEVRNSRNFIGREEDKKFDSKEKREARERLKLNSKIISSPLYCGDDSVDLDLPEYHQTEDEIKLRKSLLANERRINREKLREDQKNKEAKGETKKETEENEEGEEKDEDDENEEEEKKEEGKSIKKKKEIKPTLDELEDDSQDNQSMTSIMGGNTMRSFFSLRAAIDEKFVPLSIRNMNCSAGIVFLLVLGIASNFKLNNILVTFYVMQVTLYNKINNNVDIINCSEQRLSYLIDLNLQITKMMLITNTTNSRLANPNKATMLTNNSTVLISMFSTAQQMVSFEASNLMNSQTSLSLLSSDLSDTALAKINPGDVNLIYMGITAKDANYTYSVWQSIMEIVVSSYRISSMNIYQVDDTKDQTVYFVTENSLNNVMVSLNISSGAIMDELETSKNLNVTIFLILLSVASFSLALSTTLLIPVINKVKKNKQEVFELFMHIKKTEATQALQKCRKFLGNFQTNQETEMIVAEVEEDKQENQEEVAEEHDINAARRLGESRQMGTSRRKFKTLALDLGIVLFQFIFLILIMEGYFIMSYFLSTTFLSRVFSLSEELSMLIARLPTDSFLLLMGKYLMIYLILIGLRFTKTISFNLKMLMH